MHAIVCVKKYTYTIKRLRKLRNRLIEFYTFYSLTNHGCL